MTKRNRSPKVVLVDYEEKMSLTEVANFLETIATKLKEEGSFTLIQGEKTHDISPSQTVTLEVKLEKRDDRNKFEVELEWRDGDENKGLSIG